MRGIHLFRLSPLPASVPLILLSLLSVLLLAPVLVFLPLFTPPPLFLLHPPPLPPEIVPPPLKEEGAPPNLLFPAPTTPPPLPNSPPWSCRVLDYRFPSLLVPLLLPPLVEIGPLRVPFPALASFPPLPLLLPLPPLLSLPSFLSLPFLPSLLFLLSLEFLQALHSLLPLHPFPFALLLPIHSIISKKSRCPSCPLPCFPFPLFHRPPSTLFLKEQERSKRKTRVFNKLFTESS
mmetsp:Transcript_28360/g.43950  ORF Transcript_28360/g.43950 Transcript_28360/m.43950 type:complete len:234 (-) Transcript_28360:155-856(-)